jgi:hypothetical protein
MKRLAYLLMPLLLSAQVDDLWAAALHVPPASLADDDNYLPPRPRPQGERTSAHQPPVFVGLKPQTPDFPLLRRGVRPAWNLTTPFTPPPLSVFMSLQI